MKIKKSHYDQLAAIVHHKEHADMYQEYKSAGLSDIRFIWDSTYKYGANKFICDTLYQYLDDSHITTALKRIYKNTLTY